MQFCSKLQGDKGEKGDSGPEGPKGSVSNFLKQKPH